MVQLGGISSAKSGTDDAPGLRRVHPPGRSVWCTASAWLRRGALALGIGLLTISAAQAAGPTATQAVASQTLTKNQPSTNFTPVTGSGGVAPLTYTISPGLPSGLSISASTGAIRGSPTTTLATTSYTVTVTDANSATASNTFSLTINAAVTATRSISSAALIAERPIFSINDTSTGRCFSVRRLTRTA